MSERPNQLAPGVFPSSEYEPRAKQRVRLLGPTIRQPHVPQTFNAYSNSPDFSNRPDSPFVLGPAGDRTSLFSGSRPRMPQMGLPEVSDPISAKSSATSAVRNSLIDSLKADLEKAKKRYVNSRSRERYLESEVQQLKEREKTLGGKLNQERRRLGESTALHEERDAVSQSVAFEHNDDIDQKRALNVKLEELEKEAKVLRRGTALLEKELKGLKDKNAVSEKEVKGLKEEITAFETETKGLKGAIAVAKKEASGLRDKAIAAEKEAKALREKSAALDKEANRFREAIAVAEREAKALKEKNTAYDKEKRAAFEKEATSFKGATLAAEEQIWKLGENNAAFAREATGFREVTAAAEKQATNLREKNTASERALAISNAQLLELRAAINQIRTASAIKAKETKTLNDKLQASQAEHKTATAKWKELADGIVKAGELTDTTVKSAKLAKDEAAACRGALENIKMVEGLKAGKAAREIWLLQEHIKEIHEKRKSSRMKHDSKEADLRAEIGRLRDLVKESHDKRASSRVEQDIMTADLQAEVGKLELEIAELEDQVKLYKEDGGVMVLD